MPDIKSSVVEDIWLPAAWYATAIYDVGEKIYPVVKSNKSTSSKSNSNSKSNSQNTNTTKSSRAGTFKKLTTKYSADSDQPYMWNGDFRGEHYYNGNLCECLKKEFESDSDNDSDDDNEVSKLDTIKEEENQDNSSDSKKKLNTTKKSINECDPKIHLSIDQKIVNPFLPNSMKTKTSKKCCMFPRGDLQNSKALEHEDYSAETACLFRLKNKQHIAAQHIEFHSVDDTEVVMFGHNVDLLEKNNDTVVNNIKNDLDAAAINSDETVSTTCSSDQEIDLTGDDTNGDNQLVISDDVIEAHILNSNTKKSMNNSDSLNSDDEIDIDAITLRRPLSVRSAIMTTLPEGLNYESDDDDRKTTQYILKSTSKNLNESKDVPTLYITFRGASTSRDLQLPPSKKKRYNLKSESELSIFNPKYKGYIADFKPTSHNIYIKRSESKTSSESDTIVICSYDKIPTLVTGRANRKYSALRSTFIQSLTSYLANNRETVGERVERVVISGHSAGGEQAHMAAVDWEVRKVLEGYLPRWKEIGENLGKQMEMNDIKHESDTDKLSTMSPRFRNINDSSTSKTKFNQNSNLNPFSQESDFHSIAPPNLYVVALGSTDYVGNKAFFDTYFQHFVRPENHFQLVRSSDPFPNFFPGWQNKEWLKDRNTGSFVSYGSSDPVYDRKYHLDMILRSIIYQNKDKDTVSNSTNVENKFDNTDTVTLNFNKALSDAQQIHVDTSAKNRLKHPGPAYNYNVKDHYQYRSKFLGWSQPKLNNGLFGIKGAHNSGNYMQMIGMIGNAMREE